MTRASHIFARAFFTLAAALLMPRAGAAELIAGPMVGHVTSNSARVWMQFSEAGQVTINAYAVGSPQALSGVRLDVSGPSPFICDIPLQNLRPDRTYRIEVKFDGREMRLPPFSIRTAPIPGDAATFSVAFGSNIHATPQASTVPGSSLAADLPPLPIFDSIVSTKPRAFFFLGNTGHLPDSLEGFPQTRRAAFRYISDFHSAMRRVPAMQPLFQSTPVYAIYSDRDFGPPGATGTYEFAGESLVAFQKFWPNPDWGMPTDPGCYTTFSLGDVDFFLLDSRTFREPAREDAAPAGAEAKAPALFGAAQLEWLKKGLKESKARFKILAAPCTLWGDAPDKPDFDSWSHFPQEQKEFIAWLAAQRMDGIVALSGNHVAGEITRNKADGITYPLFTLATSSLSLPAGARFATPVDNPNRAAPPVSECTFGTLDFGGENDHRFMTLRLRDEKGKVRQEQTIRAVQLRN